MANQINVQPKKWHKDQTSSTQGIIVLDFWNKPLIRHYFLDYLSHHLITYSTRQIKTEIAGWFVLKWLACNTPRPR